MPPKVLTDGLKFPEGPVWAPDGTIYVTEIGAGRVTAIAPDGTKRVFADTGGSPNGAAFGPGGKLYVCNNGGSEPGYVQTIDPNGKIEVLYRDCEGTPFLGPKDLVFDAHGGFYFTDPGQVSRDGLKFGHLYYALADGSMIKRMQYYFYLPNGVALSPDGSTLIVLESITARVWGIPVESPGVLAQVDAGGRFARPRGPNGEIMGYLTTVPDARVPDGMCVDEAGNLLICAQQGGFVSVHSPDGKAIGRIEVEDHGLTNCCFGGPDYRTLYITESELGRVVTVEWERPGLRLNYN